MTLVLGLCTYVSLLMVLARDTSPSTRVFFTSQKANLCLIYQPITRISYIYHEKSVVFSLLKLWQ